MSMASGHEVRPFRERNQTPDSVHRGSFVQIATTVGVGVGGASTNALRNGTPPVEKEGELYRFVRERRASAVSRTGDVVNKF